LSEIQSIATGRRKESVARVRLIPGSGQITINGKDLDKYFGMDTLKLMVRQPLEATETLDRFDVIARVHGGGFSAGRAVRHGIAGRWCRSSQVTVLFLKDTVT